MGVNLVFSACAEVVPLVIYAPTLRSGILRVRGGSSKLVHNAYWIMAYSPRARR